MEVSINEKTDEPKNIEEIVSPNCENSNAKADQEIDSSRRTVSLIDDLYSYACFLSDTLLPPQATVELLEKIKKLKENIKNGND